MMLNHVANEITAIVLTLNEERYIAACLESLKWCSEVLVIDSFSTDRTVDIACQYGAKVIKRQFINYADQRNAAIEMANSNWIFFVDADERVTPELSAEIKLAIQDTDYDGWYVPRRNIFFGKRLEYGGFYPDYHLRLARRGKSYYDPQQKVHEIPGLDGEAGYLENPLIHLWYQDMHELLSSRAKYADFMAEIHFEKGIRPTYHLLAAPVYFFIKQLIFLKGYKDGKVGFLISLVWGYYAFVEYWKVWGLLKSVGRKK